jgi:Cyclic nucleotide-binding domain
VSAGEPGAVTCKLRAAARTESPAFELTHAVGVHVHDEPQVRTGRAAACPRKRTSGGVRGTGRFSGWRDRAMSPKFVPAGLAELQRIGLLAELPGETLVRLAQRMRREQVAAGGAVVEEGDDGDRFYVVLTGMFTVSQASMGARSVLRPGDYFGEVALTMDVPRTASVRALTPATVASCDRETFDEFIRPLFSD